MIRLDTWSGRAQLAVSLLLVVVGTFLFSGVFAYVAQSRPAVAVTALVVFAVGAFVLFTVPVRTMPAAALVIFAVFPAQLQPDQGIGNVLRPSLLVLYVWVLRRWWSTAGPGPAGELGPHPARRAFLPHLLTYLAALLLAVWTVITLGWSVIPTTSTSWTSVFLVSCFLPLLVLDARAEAALVRTSLLWVGGALGAYAVVEQVLRSNPVYGAVYAALGAGAPEPWAVYRSEASFGHPLWAGAFFVVPACLGLIGWLQTGRTRDGVLGALAAVGVVMTVSRGSLFALGGGLAVGVLLVGLFAARPAARRLLGVAPLALLAFAGLSVFQPLADRADSQESGLSAGVRERAVDVALRAAQQSDWLGTGPATSGVTGRTITDIVIENSLLQLLMSIGLPGLLLFLLLAGAACLAAISRRDLATAAAVAGYVAAITGFNSLDAVRSMHVLIGFLLLLALHGAPSPPVPPRSGSGRRGRAAPARPARTRSARDATASPGARPELVGAGGQR